MTVVQANLNNERVFTPKNGQEIDLDFSFDDFSPNASLVQEFVMMFVCSTEQTNEFYHTI